MTATHRDEVPDGVEIQTDKERVKIAPCRECGKDLAVSVFAATGNAICAACRSGDSSERPVASVAHPIPGKTDPAKAVDLAKCLVNPGFAQALCPAHPDDPEHEMELKSVSHHPHHGPSEMFGFKNGRPEYRQTAIGETAMHQCLKCKATVSYSTTAQSQFLRQNEVRGNQHVNGWEPLLGVREGTA